MATGQGSPVLRHVRRVLLWREGGGMTDGELLGCFIARRDEAAFAALVRRHGPMVHGVCRRVLRDVHDAEDAFQAAFLVLARKAAMLRQRELVGNWLYGVAYRTALEAKSLKARRRAHERQVTTMPEPATPEADVYHDLLPVLDQELSRLPDKYRVPMVLCDLEGRSRKEVARQLHVPEGTLSSRLATARKRLAARLARHGLALSGAALAGVLSHGSVSAGVPTPLVISTVNAAGALAAGQAATAAGVSGEVAVLTERVLKTMLLNRLQAVAGAILALAVFVGTLAFLAGPLFGQPARVSRQPDKTPAPVQAPEQPPAGPVQGERVMALKYSPDGKWLATAEDEGTLRLWDAKTQRPVRTLDGPARMVRDLAFTPNGRTLAACCDDGKIYLWDVRTGRPRKPLNGHRGTLVSLAFAADGKTLASSSVTIVQGELSANELKVWDVAAGKLVRDLRSEDGLSSGGTGLAFALGGKLLAVAYMEKFRGVKVWDVTTGEVVERYAYDAGFPLAVTFSPDGKWLASGGGGAIPLTPTSSQIIGHVKVWERKTGKLHKTLLDRTEGYFRGIVFSKDGKHLFSGSLGPDRKRFINGRRFNVSASRVHCWDTNDWGRLWTAEDGEGGGVLWTLDVSPDGRTVAASDEFGTGLIDVAAGSFVRQLIRTR